jgi:sugar O-acyltransferase (sialic acid O-acetyltransferase NeuD family)
MVIYGASGHSKVIIDIIESRNIYPIDLIIDDNTEILNIMGRPVVHSIPENNNWLFIIAIGNNVIRKKIVEKNQFNYVNPQIHKMAIVNENVEVGKGSVVMAGVVINPSCRVGVHSIINTNASLDHDVEVGDYCHVSPGAVITGNVIVGDGTQVGAGATILPGVKIGEWCTIGAGAVILNDVPDYAVVVGNPGRIIKFNQS